MAFCALLSTKTQDRTSSASSTATPATEGDAAAGGGYPASREDEEDEKTSLVQTPPPTPPPQPCPPVRMPCRSQRGLHSDGASSPGLSLSPPGTPSTANSPMAEKLMKKTSQSRYRSPLPSPEEKLRNGEGKLRKEVKEVKEEKLREEVEEEQPRESCLGWWGSSKKKSKAKEDLDWNDFCCLRDNNNYRRFEPIKEDQPETEFDKDVAMLDLHSVLRHHAVEPSEALVNDILEWQARTAERTSSVSQKASASNSLSLKASTSKAVEEE